MLDMPNEVEFFTFLKDIQLFMIQNKKQSTEYTQTQNNLYSYAIPKFLQTSGFKWIDPKNFDLNTYTSYSVLEVNLGYSKDLPELHNDLSPD